MINSFPFDKTRKKRTKEVNFLIIFLKLDIITRKEVFILDKSKEILKKERQQQKQKGPIKGDKKLNGPDRPST